MSFESFRCMEKSEDQNDEEYAICVYPKCWLVDCPHWQARDRLAKAQDWVVTRRKNRDDIWFYLSELEKVLGDVQKLADKLCVVGEPDSRSITVGVIDASTYRT